jgi:hypothetical protein
MASELAVLQTVRLKGRTTAEDVAAATATGAGEAADALQGAVASGTLTEANGRVRMTPEGRERLTALLDEERAGVDATALRAAYERFVGLNGEFKQMATDWQQRDGQPNDHSDAAYDQAVLDRLGPLHERLVPVLEEIIALAPRLAPYPGRFAAALEKVRAGDSAWFLRPLIDSYHTVWFELHEDLIGLAGLTRAEEAEAGRGA